MAVGRPDYRRVVIESCRPLVDGGGFPAKASAGLPFLVAADVFSHGHDLILAWARWGTPRSAPGVDQPRGWREVRLTPGYNDNFSGWLTAPRPGLIAYEIVGAVDDYGSWLRSLQARWEAGQDLTLEFEEGAQLAERRAARRGVSTADRSALKRLAATLRDPVAAPGTLVSRAGRPVHRTLMERTIDRSAATVAGPYPIWVDRPLGGFSAWYEMFPRSEGAQPPRSGTLQSASLRLPAIAKLGFDIVYLPPIHPIGTAFRKGANNTLTAGPGDVGSPWAIGGSDGGHTAVHGDLGTLADFDSFVTAAQRVGLEVALDYALQCSPDHPWVTEHPEWFAHRSDGSIRYAENPPKKYQDIYPINFETSDRLALWNALRDVMLFWCAHGVRVFRVDNPHTKPLHFWEWLIAQVRRQHPDTLFLAEAFTKPTVMHHLAKVGFTQSYTYFTWRNAKWELTEYFKELTAPPAVDYFRPNFWPNTPDILHDALQTGGPGAFRLRLILAALGAGSWGMYSGYELFENRAVRPGSEEYLHSEKYELRPRDWQTPAPLAPLLAQVNDIRRRHSTAIAQLGTLRLHHIDNDALFCFSRASHDSSDVLLVVVNLDPHQPQEGSTWLDLDALGIASDSNYEAHDELSDTTFVWNGPRNYVRLDPAVAPAHILHLRTR